MNSRRPGSDGVTLGYPCGTEYLPDKAHALLTIIEPNGDTPLPAATSASAGLHRFLSTPDFSLTSEQFHASMEADFFDQ